MKSHSCFFAILLSVLVSCHNSESGGGQDVETITIQTPVKQDLKNLIKDIKVIRLETSQQSLFNGIAKMDIYDDKFYILDNSRSFIIVFDKNGKFVSKIGQKGRAPYEYLTIMSFFIDKTSGNIIITDNISPKVIIYSQKGDVLQTIKPDIHPMIIAPVGDGRFVNIHRGKYARYKNSPQMYNNHIHRLNDNFEFVSGNIPDIPNKIDYISDLDSHTYRDGSLLFMPAVSDTVYKITADSTFPLIALPKGRMLQEIMVSLGGRIAEEIIFDDITTGASSDIKKATQIAKKMVTRYGMSENVGVICYDDDDDEVFIGRDLAHAKAHSELVSGEIDREIHRIIDECYAKAKALILENSDVLHKSAQLLLKKEKISRAEFEALFEKQPEDFFA